MCYQESKNQRYFIKNKSKGFSNNQPLIKDKKFSEIREKQNEKYNADYQNRSKNLSNNEINTTVEYEAGKFANNFVNMPSSYLIGDKQNYTSNDRYQHPQNNFQPQNHSKNLTFGYVRNNGLKIKEGNSYIESSFINICDTKKPLQLNKVSNQI